jgi:hypothetical protein
MFILSILQILSFLWRQELHIRVNQTGYAVKYISYKCHTEVTDAVPMQRDIR